ncbi:MAG: DUF2207 domain-containing protein [Candidatus Cryosericum sp.]
MRKLACIVLVIVAALAFLVPTGKAGAADDERILSLDSLVTIHADSTLTVQETIQCLSAGVTIRHGLYRDFPTSYTDPQNGRTTRVSFQVVGLTRDGQSEPWHAQNLTNGVRVYFGSSAVDLPPGEHAYVFTYTSDRQLGFFEDHDELYWNVTGNGWEYPIDRASCTVLLPGTAWQKITDRTAFTGPQGARGTAYAMSRDAAGNPVFTTTAPLAPLEGLSIVVGWQKGFVAPPNAVQSIRWWLRDNRSASVGAASIIGLLLYFTLTWMRVGRDPRPGTIIPQYAPPEGMSPAAVRYVRQMGSDPKTFAAAVTGLAVRRALVISESEDGEFSVDSTGMTPTGLAADETALLEELFDGRTRTKLTFKQSAHSRVQSVQKALDDALRSTYSKGYFVTNVRYAVTGIALSVAGIVAAGLIGATQPERTFGFLFMSVWLSMWTFGTAALLAQVIASWRRQPASTPGKRALSLPASGCLTVFAIPFLLGEIFGIFAFVAMAGPLLLALVFITAAIDYIFFRLMRAYTPHGRAVLDQIDGFRLYLGVAEKGRIDMLTPPDHTPETYERYLPYAMALDVEKEWSDKFADVLSGAGASGEPSFQPAWFVSSSGQFTNLASLGTSLSGSLTSAVSSSSVAPGHSSGFGGGGGGGGGGSGGGGGGGGGGGW